MFMQSNSTDSIVLLSTPPQPTVNSVIQYMRCGRLITGKLLGTHWYEAQRYNAVVCEYVIVPDPGYSNLSFHIVQEDEIIWQKPAPVCARCNGAGVLSIRGDETVDCPVCGDSGEMVF